MTSVKLATTAAEREEVFRLRYEVYVEEMGFPFVADSARLTDPLDATATIFVLREQARLVGTLRVSAAHALPEAQEAEARYRLSLFCGYAPEAVFLGSRAILRRSARGGRQMRYLFCEVFRWGLARGAEVTLIDSSPELVPLYERLGWVRYADHFRDAALGERVPLVLYLRDLEHLRRIASPFCAVLEAGAGAWAAGNGGGLGSAESGEWVQEGLSGCPNERRGQFAEI